MSAAYRLANWPTAARRTLALAGLTLVVLVVWGGVVTPFEWLISSQSAWREQARRSLAQERGWKNAAAPWGELERQVQAAPIWQKFLEVPAGATPGAAAQRHVEDLFRGELPPVIEALATRHVDGLTAYPVRVTTSMTIDQLKDILLSSHTHGAYLRVERLQVTAPQAQLPQQNARLQVNLDLVAYARRGVP